MNKKKNKRKRKPRIFFLFRLIILFLIIILVKNIFFEQKNNQKTIFILGSEIIELKNEIFVDLSDNIYISYDDIKALYDENIFYDEVNKMLITTYNKHVAILYLDDYKILINDSENSIKGKLMYNNDILYLPFSDMKLVYDFEYKYAKDSNRLIVDSISKEENVSNTLKKVKVKNKPKAFSKKICSVDENEEVNIFSVDKNYTKIRTSNGFIGYVKNKALSSVKSKRTNMMENKIENVNILKEYCEITEDLDSVEVPKNKNNVVILDLLSVSDEKNVELLVTTTGEKYQKYKDFLDENSIQVWATLKNDIDVSDCMVTYNDRKELIEKIYSKLIDNNYKYININFDKINDINSFYRFLIEITPKLKESGISTIVTYKEIMNEEKVTKIVDYVVKDE